MDKKADLILLNQNLLTIQAEAIPAAKVLATTMFDGRIVSDRAYGIGDANLTELDTLDQGAAGCVPTGGLPTQSMDVMGGMAAPASPRWVRSTAAHDSMDSLQEELLQVDPALAAGSNHEFRATLVAISQRLEQEPEAETHSLQAWWEWLDDEGFDREAFAATLRQICQSILGDGATPQLLSSCRAMTEQGQDLASLFEHLHQTYPLLVERLGTLETRAVEDQAQLESRAGGVSKKNAAIIGGSLGTFFAGCIITYLIVRAKRRRAVAQLELENKAQRQLDHKSVSIEDSIKRLELDKNTDINEFDSTMLKNEVMYKAK